ncbi:MAG: PucR family transcriptional regulator ligand-binding domain-containing protein [Ruminiclostridium sp.]|nr:PucR family transcriptional regulator ligand-binding domain-containing protein [Ruminiclostridium sp.]
MSITVSKLCANAQANYVMKLIAGKAGLNNYVRWVHLIENADVSPFLHGNEMVFITGVGINSESHLMSFVEELTAKRCSALVINTGKYIKSIPESVKDFCDINSLPLFTVPWEVRLIDITYDFCHRIVTGEEIETALATALRNLIFSPENETGYKPTLERRGYYQAMDYCIGICSIKSTLSEEDMKKAVLADMQKVLNTCGKQFSFFFQDKNLVMVCPDCNEQDVRQLLSAFDSIITSRNNDISITCGISPSKQGYKAISDGYRKAVMALRVASLHGSKCTGYSDMGIYKLLVHIKDTSVLHEIYDETLGVLEEFDSTNGTDYMDTLRCYLENDSSVQEVARIMFVHRNTVNYKLRRIKEILGCELNYEDKLKLMLSFFIKEFL